VIWDNMKRATMKKFSDGRKADFTELDRIIYDILNGDMSYDEGAEDPMFVQGQPDDDQVPILPSMILPFLQMLVIFFSQICVFFTNL
jgi:hypothetical protein